MASITQTSPLTVSSAQPARLLRSLALLVGTFAAAKRADDLYRELTMLSDDALAARGICRGDIPAIAARELCEH